MSRLSDVIGRVVELESGPEGIDLHHAVSVARPMLDEEDVETLICEALTKRIKDAATRGRMDAMRAADNAQSELPFPDLRVRHAVDLEGRRLVNTEDMTEMQFRRVIEIRRKQLKDDRSYLDVLEQAYRQIEPIWRAHPDLTFGQACRICVQSDRQVAAAAE